MTPDHSSHLEYVVLISPLYILKATVRSPQNLLNSKKPQFYQYEE